ncbi:arsenate reductase ArsC [Desulfogranum marinum]|uniref:arsenate reductase ArsC n=1 Tax=Desulfogranum marinum TaxID=453220 RepID=UPI0019654255|nr:arsenate reductase ArsC [Desulfogranum marinum]MBM9514933.1 arsenate reductase ArsC [Desulfogranum marinum]
MNAKKTTILFLCTGNSCRSQMAEGWAKALKNEEISSWSAGIEKHGLNPLAVKAMAESGVNISRQESKVVDELPVKEFDWVITLCGHADETCPFFPGKRMHMGFDDPPKLAEQAENEEEKLVHYRRVRDEIRDFILSLPDSLSNK